jgi:pilus assembly protein CpaB
VNSKPLIMIIIAFVFGGLGILIAQRVVIRQAKAPPAAPVVERVDGVKMSTVVVAAKPLRHGVELSADNVREVAWPEAALPAGTFRSVPDLLAGNGKRTVLSAIETNEPVLQPKITGPGQRATLSALIEDGMGAVTVQVNEVIGVAGFVLPGDRVDVLLTRQNREGGEAGPANLTAFTDVVLRNVRVLASGQTADDRTDRTSVVNAVTLEVDSIAAQKIALATASGTLSLMLRKAGDLVSSPGRRVSLAEIGHEPKAASDQKVVRVTRGTERREYSVPGASATSLLPIASSRPGQSLPQVAAAP